MDAIRHYLLSANGIVTLTLLLLFVMSLIYCRIVTGTSFLKGLRMLPALIGGSALMDVRAGPKLDGLFQKARALRGGKPSYEQIAPTISGGDGKGTVAEVLAQQTELKIVEGEEIEDDFMIDLIEGNSSVSDYESLDISEE